MTSRTCSSCSFWLGTTTATVRGDGVPVVTTLPGQCRARPPERSGWWPQTRATDWCGEHTGHYAKVEDLFAMGEGR